MIPRGRTLLVATLACASWALPSTTLAQDDGPPEPVTVKITREGEAVGGLALRIVGQPPGGGEITYGSGNTDPTGTFVLPVPFRPGLVLHAEATFEGVKYQSPERPFAGQPGRGLTLAVKVFSTSSATAKDLSLSPDSHLLVEIDEGFLDITEVLFVINGSRGAFAPEGGLPLRLPAGHRDVQGIGGEPVTALEHVGAAIPGPFLPGRTEVQVRFELPFDEATLDFAQPLDLPWAATRVIIDEVPGLRFKGAQIQGQELREASGRQLRLVSVKPAADGLKFTITGLPVRHHNGRWVALGLAILVAVFGFLGGILPTRETEGSGEARLGLEAERSSLLEELEELERDRQKAALDEETYAEDRGVAIDQLAAVLRALDDLDTSDRSRRDAR